MANKLEGKFKSILNEFNDIMCMKLQVNPMAHCRTPADYLVISNEVVNFVECKMCNNNSFPFSRFVEQLNKLLNISKLKICNCFLLLGFFTPNSRFYKNDIYLIEINHYISKINKFHKKSINRKDCLTIFKDCKIYNSNDLYKFCRNIYK